MEFAIKLLHEAYATLPVAGTALTEKRLAVVVRLYALGSFAVRLGNWEAFRAIILRPVKIHPDCTDADVAEAIYNVVRLTMREAFKFDGRWWEPPPSVQEYLTVHGQQEA